MKRYELPVSQAHLRARNAQTNTTSPERDLSGHSTEYVAARRLAASDAQSNAAQHTTASGHSSEHSQTNKKELFSNKLETGESGRERKNSSSSAASMKSKWLKAFKSLKTPPSDEKKNGSASRELLKGDPDVHNFQEYTYKKITPCDICSQVLRGHTRQGLKCRMCKMNVHVACQEKASKCQPKTRLLRRQKSTSEIETRILDAKVDHERPTEVDLIYQVLKQAGEISNKPRVNLESGPGISVESGAPGSSGSSGQSLNRRGGSQLQSPRNQSFSLCVINQAPCSTSSAPSSPVHNRRLLSAKNIRMSSLELPDDNEKSPSPASISPCPSPIGANKKTHRLLPTNLYVVLYNFKSRHQDELNLKAGYKVTVIDNSDPDWWKGKCLGRVGYFPSKYCSKLSSGEKALQVTHNLQVSDGDNGLMLLRDQIVIQIGEELDGMVMIRSGDNRQGICPMKFLQEV